MPALIDALVDRADHTSPYAAKALRAITGQDHGVSYEKWRDWYVNRNK